MGMTPRFDVAKLQYDLDARGWLATDLARAAGLANNTIGRVIRGERSNPRTWAQIAKAMGHTVRRYQLPLERVA